MWKRNVSKRKLKKKVVVVWGRMVELVGVVKN